MTEKRYRRKLAIRSVLSGEKCAVCGENRTGGEDLFCPRCREMLANESERICMTCARPVRDCLCVRPGMADAGCDVFIKLFFYGSIPEAPQNRLIYRLKNMKDGLLHARLAEKLAEKLTEVTDSRLILKDEAVICHVPRSRRRAAAAGTDQAKELAKALAAETGIRFVPLLDRLTEGEAQKQLDAAGRARNVRGMFGVVDPEGCLIGKTAILVDDLVTTGATVSECSSKLCEAGAERVVCVAIASDE